MTTHRRARRRASILLAGAVALSTAGCSSIQGEPSETSSTAHVPLTTTSTTEPTTSSSTTAEEGKPSPPQPAPVLTAVRDRMATHANVTIDGTLHDVERDLDITIHAEGSTGGVRSRVEGGGGISRTTLTLADGGTFDSYAIGWDHYLKVDQKWIDATRVKLKSPLRKNVGRWIKVPGKKGSPVDGVRPYTFLRTFYGDSLTQFDQLKSDVTVEELGGGWTYRIPLARAGDDRGRGVQRTVWVSSAPQAPEMLKMTFGRYPDRTTLTFSRWGKSREDFTAPVGARTLKDADPADLGGVDYS